MMPAHGAGIAPIFNTDRVSQLLLRMDYSSLHTQEKGSSEPLHPLPGPSHLHTLPLITLSWRLHLSPGPRSVSDIYLLPRWIPCDLP